MDLFQNERFTRDIPKNVQIFARTRCHKTFEHNPFEQTTFQAYNFRPLTCMVARAKSRTQSHLHFAPSTRTIFAEGCLRPDKNAISPAFRAFDTHDLRRVLLATGQKRNLTCISRLRYARSPQRVDFRDAPAAPPPNRRCEDEQRCRCADVKT